MLLIVFGAPALAQTCPPAPDHADAMAALVEQLQSTNSPTQAAPLTQTLWDLWLDAPDDIAQTLLDHGMQRRKANDFLGARDLFNDLVAYCPDYAEGYNQRAFASFLRRDYEAALVDLNRAIDLIPNHIAALSGRGLTLLGLGRQSEANASLRQALTLNPWLGERRFIIEPDGTDI